jgi:16S rRNA (guanine(527)-N(7))-methyltransferase RsmG
MNRFEQALLANMGSFGLDLSPESVTELGKFYSLLTRWNERLHLVAPCEPEEFAVRHVLESLLLLHFLPPNARVADVGSGGGLPIIPCLTVRPDLDVTMIESSQKKAVFLREAVGKRAKIVAKRFQDVDAPAVSFVTCRALDQFTDKISALIDWAPKGSTLLLFGGDSLSEKIDLKFERFLIPQSERRFIYLVADKAGSSRITSFGFLSSRRP